MATLSAEAANRELYEEKPVFRALMTLILPTVLGQLVTVLYNVADTFFIGQLNDPDQVAAATISLPLYMAMTAISNLFGVGGGSLIARALGSGKPERARRCSSFCFWSAGALSLVYGLSLYLARGLVLPWIGTDAYTYDYTVQYLLWTTVIGGVPTVLNPLLAHLFRAEGYARQASLGVMLGGVLNIALDPLFIFVFHRNIEGAAIATMVSNLVATLYFLILWVRMKNKTVVSLRIRDFSARESIGREVFTGGVPSFVLTFFATLSNMFLTSLTSHYSNAAIAGFGVAKKLDYIVFAVATGMTQGALPLIAYNYASGNKKRMSRSIVLSLTLAVITETVIMILLLLLARPITYAFIREEETVRYGTMFLRINCVSAPLTALNMMLLTIFQATRKKLAPLILSFLRKGTVDIPIMFLLDRFFGAEGLLWTVTISDAIALTVGLCFFVPFARKQSLFSGKELSPAENRRH